MASQQGILDWSTYLSGKNVWIAAREVGTADNLKAQIRFVNPPSSGGVGVGQGFFHQTTRASPKAPMSVTVPAAFACAFSPSLDEDSSRHFQAVHLATGIVEVWLPWMIHECWRITAARTQYSLPWTITGTSTTWPTGITPFNEPVVEVRETGGALDSTLTRVASGPTSAQYELPNDDTGDSGYVTTGDLTAKDGKDLHIWAFGKVEVRRFELDEGFAERNSWEQALGFAFAPSPKDYEGD